MAQGSRASTLTGLVADEIPPHSLEAERAVLGAMLLDQDAQVDGLLPTHFFKEGHRTIFSVVCALRERGAPTDLLTVSEELKRLGRFEEVGGGNAVAQMMDEATTKSQLPHYVGIVRAKAALRESIAGAFEILHAAYDPQAEINALLEKTEALHVTLHGASSPEAFAPTVTRDGEAFTIRCPASDAVVRVEHLEPDFHADVMVERRGQIVVPWSRGLLSSETFRRDLRKQIADPAIQRALIDHGIHLVIEAGRQSATAVLLTGARRTGSADLFAGYVPVPGPTGIYCPGGKGKSKLLFALAALIITGERRCGLKASRTGPVVFLDYEGDEATTNDTFGRLEEGMNLSGAHKGLVYMRLTQPIWREIKNVRRRVQQYGAAAVILDTLGSASAGTERGVGPETPTGAILAMNALAELGSVPTIFAAHVNKEQAERAGPSQVFGSVYVSNRARMMIELQGEQDGPVLFLGLQPRKANDMPLPPPLALKLVFDGRDGPIRLERADMVDAPDTVLAKTRLPDRILALLGRMRKPSSTDVIAEAAGAKAKPTWTALERLKKAEKVVKLTGSDKRVLWALAETKREAES